MLLTIDSLVESVDFDLGYCAPADVGWKAVAVNLSDIAAMGGRPRHAVTALWLPGHTPIAVAEGIAAGLSDCCGRYGLAMVGGDVSGASEIGVAVAVTGEVDVEPVTRGGAEPGHLLGVTGHLGAAAAGLSALRAGRGSEFSGPAERHLRPQPRLSEGAVLARAGVSAMIDLSDGLAPDLGHLTEASGVGCEVDTHALPVHRGAEEVAAAMGIPVLDLAVAGGEDYELLFSVAPERLDAVQAAMAEPGTTVTVIGRFTSRGVTIAGRSLEEWKEKAWEHLRPR
jgi:thiamine-monophosphate kinase